MFPSLPFRAPSRQVVFSIGLSLACLLGLTAGAATAQPVVTVGDGEGVPGATVGLPVSLSAPTGTVALQVDLVFDPDVLSTANLAGGPALVDHVLDWATVAPGRLRVTLTTATRSALGADELFTVPFDIAGDAPAGEEPIDLEAVVLSDDAGLGIAPLELVPGTLTVLDVDAPVEIPTLGGVAKGVLILLLVVLGLVIARSGGSPGGPSGLVLLLVAVLATLMIVSPMALRAQSLSPGDANGDGDVDAADIPVIVDQILERAAAPGDPDCNVDLLVDVRDTICAVQPGPTNSPPTLVAIADRAVREREIVALTADAIDPDLPNDTLTWSLLQGPAGASIDADLGTLLWVPAADQLGDHPITVLVTDAAGASDQESFEVTVRGLGGPPVLEPIANRTTVVGAPIAVDADATDPDLPGDTLTFSLSLSPAGMSIDPASGLVSWTPGSAEIGLHDVTVQVTDSEGLLDFASFVVTVGSVNGAPVASDDVYVARTGETLAVPTSGVLENDFDPNDDPLTVELVTGPTNGALDLAPDGSFTYAPTGPGSVQTGIDLTRFSSIGVEASDSYNASYLPERVADGYLETSWFTDRPPSIPPFVQILFADPGVLVREVRIFGNRQFPDGYDFLTGFVSLLDDAGAELWNSGSLDLPGPDRDLVVDVDPPVAAVFKARFTGTDWEGAPNNDPGLSELQVIGDGPVLNLSPDLEWAWTADSIGSTNVNDGDVLMSPTVGDLDGDGFPEVLLITARLHVLYVLDGRNGSILWSAPDIYRYSSSPVIGNLDDTAGLEVATVRDDARTLVVFDHDGTLIDEADTGRTVGEGNLAVADLDGDLLPEIIVPGSGRILAYHLIAGELQQLFESSNDGCGNNSYRSNCIPVVADVDLDGSPEIVAGNVLYGADGSTLIENTSLPDGWNAIGNFDDDPFAEIVLVRSGDAWLLEHDLSIVWGPIDLPGAGAGGPPTVADFDGDGEPEIGVAGSNRYGVLDTDGSVLWAAVTVDGSSNRTGSTVFDFQNDGSAEVVYRDERNLWIFRGADGAVLFSTSMGSATTVEYPIVADIDADGEAEIVVPSDAARSLPDGTQRVPGLYAFGSGAGTWVRTRPIWNQHTYHVTNVLADGTIPAVEQPSWLLPALNHYRQNDFLPDEAARADRFTYRARDAVSISNTATVFLDLQPANTAPQIVSIPDRTATAGFPYLHAVRAVDSESDPLVFSLTTSPPGMTIDSDTGLVRWTPGDTDLGPNPVAVKVTDDDGFSTQQGFQIEVVAPIEVPGVVGLDETSAESSLIGAGLVAEQQPPAGAAAEPGAPVALALSLGRAPEDIDDDVDGFTENQGDCNDGDGSVYPGAIDIPGDGIDQNCDGADATLPIESVIVEPEDPVLLAGEVLGLRAFGIHADGTARNVTVTATWTSTNTAAVQVVAGRIFAIGAGIADVSAEIEGKSDVVTVTVVAAVPTDDDPATVEILSPEDGESVVGPIDVIGTAVDPNLVRYELLVSPADQESFTPIGGGTAPVVGGVLGQLDPTLMLNDLYTLRLLAVDAGGNVIFDQVAVQVEGQQKVGLFTLAFTDLEVPVSGIPITVTRTYDSRDKRLGDFGIGWRLGLRTIELTCTELGEGWFVAGGGLSYQLLPLVPHRCSLSVPDGRVEVFDMTVSPQVSPIVPFPPSVVRASFRPRPGTRGTLQSLDNNLLSIFDPQPGPVTLLDDLSLRTYQPTRFRYRSPDGTEVTFRTEGGVESIRDRNGNQLTLGPNGFTHSSAVGVTFARDVAGRITAINDPLGNSRTYAYSAAGDLVAATDARGNTTRFFYDLRHNLLRMEDPLGNNAVRTEYDTDGRMIRQIDAKGNEVVFDHDLGTRQETITDRLGNVTRHEYDERGNVTATVDPLGNRWERTYDAFDNELTYTDPLGNTVTNTYDDQGRPLTTTDPLGGVVTMAYDAVGNLLTLTDPLGNQEVHTYDERGNRTSTRDPEGNETRWSYDESGNVLAERQPDGAVTTYTYDAQGRLASWTNPEGTTLVAETDANGQITSERRTKVTDTGPEEVVWGYGYDPGGHLTGLSSPLGEAADIDYDANGQLVGSTDPVQDWQLERDALGQPTRATVAGLTTTVVDYDAEGRAVEATLAEGLVIERSYDPMGRATRNEVPDTAPTTLEYDEVGRPRSLTDAAGGTRTWSYDANGRLVRTDLPGGASIETTYDAAGRVTSTTDPNGNTISFEADGNGQTTRIGLPDGSELTRAYDAVGRLESQTDLFGLQWSYEYSSSGVLAKVHAPDGTVTTYSHDSDGALDRVTDPKGQTTLVLHDARGRTIGRTLPMGQTTECDYDSAGRPSLCTDYDGTVSTFSYDDAARTTTRTAPDGTQATTFDQLGRMATATDALGITQLSRDGAGRLTRWSEPAGRPGVDYGWDAAGRLQTVTTDLGTATYAYDARGFLASRTEAAGTTTWVRDDVGHPLEVELPDGSRVLRTFDSVGQLLEVEYRSPTNGLLERLIYTQAANGQIATVEAASGRRVTYTYDPMGRLEQETVEQGGNSTETTYAYDVNGNLLERNGPSGIETFTYDANDRLLTGGAWTYTWDANGNLLARSDGAKEESFTYDSLHRLTRFERTGSSPTTVDYDYAADGLLLSRTESGERIDFVWDRLSGALPRLIETRDSSGTLLRRFEYDELGPLRMFESGLGQRMLLTDHLGTVNALVDGETLVGDSPADAYGVRPGALATDLDFLGAYRDADSGLIFLQHRWYSPEMARFTQPDEAEGDTLDSRSLNRYAYAYGDPINRVDPDGRLTLVQKFIVAFAIIGVVTASLAIYASARSFGSFGAAARTLFGLSLAFQENQQWSASFAFDKTAELGFGAGAVGSGFGYEVLTFGGAGKQPYGYFTSTLSTSQPYFNATGGTSLGMVFDTPAPPDYSGWFFAFNISGPSAAATKINKLVQKAIRKYGGPGLAGRRFTSLPGTTKLGRIAATRVSDFELSLAWSPTITYCADPKNGRPLPEIPAPCRGAQPHVSHGWRAFTPRLDVKVGRPKAKWSFGIAVSYYWWLGDNGSAK